MSNRSGGVAVLRCGTATADASRGRLSGLLAQHMRAGQGERGSLGAGRGPASLEVNNSASGTNYTMDTMRVLVLWLPRAWGLGAVRMVAARTPSPSSPVLVIGKVAGNRTGTSDSNSAGGSMNLSNRTCLPIRLAGGIGSPHWGRQRGRVESILGRVGELLRCFAQSVILHRPSSA